MSLAIANAPPAHLTSDIHNALGSTTDGFSHTGGQAGVHLNLRHRRAQAEYALDQQLRADRPRDNTPVDIHNHEANPEATAPRQGARAVGRRPEIGRKTSRSAHLG